MTKQALIAAREALIAASGEVNGDVFVKVMMAIDTVNEALAIIDAALAQQDDMAAAMSAVADRYAHKLALDLECVLADYNGKWYDTAMDTICKYRTAMNEIHEQVSPTFMGEPVIAAAQKEQT